jgi:hypothetical protein
MNVKYLENVGASLGRRLVEGKSTQLSRHLLALRLLHLTLVLQVTFVSFHQNTIRSVKLIHLSSPETNTYQSEQWGSGPRPSLAECASTSPCIVMTTPLGFQMRGNHRKVTSNDEHD